jgi:hypothetical protein
MYRFAALALVIASPFAIVMYMRHAKRVKMDEYNAQYSEPVTPLAEADRTAIAKLLADREHELVSARDHWREHMAHTALLAIKPGTGACPQPGQLPSDAAMNAYVVQGTTDPSFAHSDFYAYTTDKPIPAEAITEPLRALKAIAIRFDQGNANPSDRATLEEIGPYLRIVVIDREVPAEVTGERTFTPGHITGRSYLYSLHDAKIVCAGKIDATNRDDKTSPYVQAFGANNAKEILHREMEIRIRQSLVADLHAL